jgi:hypothetical protein
LAVTRPLDAALAAERRAAMATMAVGAKKLDVKIGDVVEIDGRRHESCPTEPAV